MVDQLKRLQAALADRYRIERELGHGGMATVYLAHDLKHDRDVALKVFRPDLAAVLGGERFLREIRITARLNHPHILPLLDSGESGGFLYYAMPHVEGESVRQRLEREGALPVGDVVRILRDVVDALTEAHAHGVVHRDIKPANILLQARHALVADFGVAKAVSEATEQQALTTAGVAIGTPAYMAPEQASADPHVDHRVDIYAVGAVAYEMLTGRPVFMGTTPQMVLVAHMTEAPVPISGLRSAVPRPLEALVMRCLEKRPGDRWQSAAELLSRLEPILTPTQGTTPPETRAVQTPVRKKPFAIAAAVIAGLAAAGLIWRNVGARPALDITVSDMTAVTTDPGVEFQPALSPDGQEVAYVAGAIGAPHLAIRSTANLAGGGEVRSGDPSLQSEWFPSWSAAGDLVRFGACRAEACAWYETGKLGGVLRTLRLPRRAQGPLVASASAENVFLSGMSTRQLAWSPAGDRVAFVIGDTIFGAPVGDTVAHRIAVQPTEFFGLHSLAWSPAGERIAWVNGNYDWLRGGNVAGSSIWTVSASGGDPVRVTTNDFLNVSPAWLDEDHLLFVSNRDGPRGVYVVEVGPRGGRGEAKLIPGIAEPHSISYSAGARKLAWAKLTLRQNIRSYPLATRAPVSIRAGSPLTRGSQVIEQHDVSPDGRWLAFDSNRRGDMDIYRMLLSGGDPVPVTDFPGDEYAPHWSPDGTEIAYFAADPDCAGGQTELMLIPVDGGVPRALTCEPGRVRTPAWSPDGLSIAFLSFRPGRVETWLLSRDSVGGAWHEAVQLTGIGGPVSWTPDGRGVLVSPNVSELILVAPDRRVLRRYDLAGANGLTRLAHYHFSRDGRILYIAAAHRDGRAGIWALPAEGGRERLVIAFDDPALAETGLFSVGPEQLFLTVGEYESDIWVASLRF